MKRKIENWTLERVLKEWPNISFPEYQREKSLWSTEKKSLLIDTILEDIDIPKLYFNRTATNSYEVVDGQQRLWAIWEFFGGAFNYKKQKFMDLTAAQQSIIKTYTLQITVFDDADEAYLRKLFVRLQIALLLVTGEKLHAASGEMKDLVFDKLSQHRFIKALKISPKRFSKQTLCSQICINSFTRKKLGSFISTRYENLVHFYQEYSQPQGRDKELFDSQSQRVVGILNELWRIFGTRAGELSNRSYVLSIYLFVEELLGEDDDELTDEERRIFVSFIFRLWKRLKEEAKKGFDRTNKELYTFGTYLSSAPTEKYQIENRHLKLRDYYVFFKETGKIKGDE